MPVHWCLKKVSGKSLYGNEICDKYIAEKQEMSVMYKKCFVDVCKIKCFVCLNVLRFGASILLQECSNQKSLYMCKLCKRYLNF